MTEEAPPPSPRPGWYPDPSGAAGQRYFDGTGWSDSRAPLRSKTEAPQSAKFWLGVFAVMIAIVAVAGLIWINKSGKDHDDAFLEQMRHNCQAREDTSACDYVEKYGP